MFNGKNRDQNVFWWRSRISQIISKIKNQCKKFPCQLTLPYVATCFFESSGTKQKVVRAHLRIKFQENM